MVTWADANNLSINIKKTQAIVFGSSTTVNSFKKLNISKTVVMIVVFVFPLWMRLSALALP